MIEFILNPPGKCPKCFGPIKFSYAELDENNKAILNYSCPKCGIVKVQVYDTKPK
jgi:hypothetical protein